MPPREENNLTLDDVFRDPNLFSDGQSEQSADAGQTGAETTGVPTESVPPAGQTEAVPAVEAPANVPSPAETSAQSNPSGVVGNPAQPDASAILNLLIPAFRAMQTENQQLKQSMVQQSDDTKAKLEDALEPPTLDIDGMMYADDATRQQKQAEYNNAMFEYQRKMIMKEMQPVVDSYRRQQQDQAIQGAISGLHNTPGIGNRFDDVASDIPQVIKSIPALASLPPNEQVTIAALVAKGRAAVNAQAKTPEQIATDVYANPEVMKLLELKRTQALQANQNIPPMSASQGAVAAAPVNVDHKPETVADAFEELTKMLRAR